MGKTYLLDTNTITKYFQETLSENGLQLIDSIIDSKEIYISVINRIELLSWRDIDENMKNTIGLFLDNANEYSLTEEIIDKTVELRHKVNIKLPDAVIAATAIVSKRTLVSTNDKDFLKVPYLKYLNPNNSQ
jgi:predicted nucleic acid-binding protein